MSDHPVDKRDREQDLRRLADAFFAHLCLVPSKRDVEMWGIDPKYPLGGQGTDYAENVLHAIGYFEAEECESCGHTPDVPEMDDTAREYALELHAELGTYIERRWSDLNEMADASDEASEETEEADEVNENDETPVCYNCEGELDSNDYCPVCDYCEHCGCINEECECEECEECECVPCECDLN